ncbi:MAG: carbamoyltransferase C-terminal domain-containing protein [Bacteroidota bacterium]
MNILGINFGHDCSACLIMNGQVVNAIEEEKISRIKQDFGWPKHAVELLLKNNNLSASDVNIVSFGGMNYLEIGANEIRYRFDKSKTNKYAEYLDRILAYGKISPVKMDEKNIGVFKDELVKKGFTNAQVQFNNHHLAHAYSAFYAAPFTSDLVITADGYGDGESFNFYTFQPSGLTALHINDHTVSPGLFYSMITKLLGFRPTRHEGKITGLAAYGKPTKLVDDFTALFFYEDGKLRRYPHTSLNQEWEKYSLSKNMSLSEKINLNTSEYSVGVDYAKRGSVLLEKLKELTSGHTKEDIAFACQYVTEQVVLNEIRNVIKAKQLKHPLKISMAGGVFANVRINQKIYELPEVENVFIQPAMGDSGLALGAALITDIGLHKKADTEQYRFRQTYIGPDYAGEVNDFVNRLDKGRFTISKMENPAKTIAESLAKNVIVGFWHGSMEWGPRALGRRSMILNTFNREVNDTLNKRLNRTEFMPFAPSVIDYKIKEYMPKYDETCPAADYMTITYDVDPQYHEQLQAVVHVDGTARPQLVKKETNPYYYGIIDEFYKLTGCGAIVNTSFNVHEEPIVSTPQSAFKALEDKRIDALVLDDYFITNVN